MEEELETAGGQLSQANETLSGVTSPDVVVANDWGTWRTWVTVGGAVVGALLLGALCWK